MKLHLCMLEQLIDLPSRDAAELRHVLDDLIGEVKNVESGVSGAVFDLESLANRGDHVCAIGIAREFSARYLTALKVPAMVSELPAKKAAVPVRKATDKCPRYALLEMAIPRSMKLRGDIAKVLEVADNERHAIVHVLNYVMLELGQPMHAFDQEKIEGEIIIELSEREEKIKALDGEEYSVPAGSILIRDKKKIVAVAGVIGCENTMVTASTTKVLIESACFDPVCVRKTARAMGLSTDASYIFERGSDYEAILPALKRAAYLAGAGGGALKDLEPAHMMGLSLADGAAMEKRKLSLSIPKVKEQMNLPRLGDLEITTRLKNLGFQLEPNGEGQILNVTVPSWRIWDVSNEEDLIEEFARAHGLSKVKLDLPPLDYSEAPPSRAEVLLAKVEPALLGQGFYEVMTKSLYSAEEVAILSRFDPQIGAQHLAIKNSLERGYSHMKITNLPHLARLAENNLRRGVVSFKAYEFGRLFALPEAGAAPDKDGYDFERDYLTLVQGGRWNEHEWQKPESQQERIFLFKGVLEGALRAFNAELLVGEGKHKLLHPGMQGCLKVGRAICGHFGYIHPLLKEALDLRNDLIYAEIETGLLPVDGVERVLEMPSEFPAVRRDITLKVPQRELAQRVLKSIEDEAAPNLAEVVILDDFRKSDEDFRRLTLRMTFQSSERTLQSSEVDEAVQRLLSGIREARGYDLA